MGVSQVRKVSVASTVALLAIVLVAVRVDAQPGGDAPRAAEAAKLGSMETAKKLVADGIAAQEAHDYGRAIGLYLKAFSLNPHPLLLFDVAQAYRLAGCFGRAGLFYERYLVLEPRGTQAEASRWALAGIKRGGKPDDASCASTADVVDTADRAPAEAASAMGRLKLRSTPGGMSVMLDGVKIGVTPVEHEVAAGAHMVSLLHRDRLVGEQRVEVGADAVVDVTIPVSLKSEGAPRSRLAPVLLWVGGGLALAGSGVAFYYGQKGWPDDNYSYRGATATGGVLAGAGLVAIGVGTGLWLRGAHEPGTIAAAGHGGAYFGWSGRF